MEKEKNNIPKVSIIMTVKNGEKYLKKSLESISKQTLKDIEIVCIYADSVDKTLNILEEFEKEDNRLKIYNQEKPGIGAAKNLGIEKSIGEFITFLDSDDYYMDKNALSEMYTAAKENDVNVCGGLRSILNMDGKIEPLSLHRAFLVGFPKGRMFYYNNVQYDYHFHSYIYNRDMIQNSDARFAETKVYDDTHFFIRAMVKAEKFYVVPVELYCYRLHEGYSWSNVSCYDAIKSLTDQLKYTSEHRLAIGHYIAVQRANYEYGPLFETYIRSGDFKMLELMLEMQNCIDYHLIDKILKNKPDNNMLDPMCFPNCEVKQINTDGNEKYVLTVLYNLITASSQEHLYDKIEDIYNSKTYKTGKVILWLPKKILQILHLKK